MIEVKQIPSFYYFDKVVKDYLKYRGMVGCDDNVLFTIGEKYHSFIHAQGSRLTLHVPWYSRNAVSTVVEYLVKLDLLYKLVVEKPIQNYEGMALFNIFSDGSQFPKSRRRLLTFNKSHSNLLFFDGDTTIVRDRFFPVFITSQLQDRSHDEAIHEAFYFFDAIVNNGLLKQASLLDLSKDLALILNAGEITGSEGLKTKILSMAQVKGGFAKALNQLKNLDIFNVIAIRYPYSQSIDSRIFKAMPDKTKRFDLILRERIFFSDVQNHDLILTRGELYRERGFDVKSLLNSYQIINTEHSKRIDEIILELRGLWITEGFNPYKTPFPTKWLLCVNRNRDLEWWTEQYQKDFPGVKGSLLNLVFELIRLLYEYDWWANQQSHLTGSNVVIPNSNLFPAVVNVLFEHLSNIAASVHFSDDQRLQDFPANLVCYDALNVNLVLNCDRQIQKSRIRFIIPDFFHYRMSPFFLLVVWDKITQARFGGARQSYGSLINESNQIERKQLLAQLAVQFSSYKKRFFEKESGDEVVQDGSHDNETDLFDSEVSEIISQRYESVEDFDAELTISATDGTDFKLKGSSRILLEEMGRLVTAKACLIIVGSRFFPIGLVSKHVNAIHLADRMSAIPLTALRWTVELSNRRKREPALFQNLKARGLSILEATFKNSYLSDGEDDFFVPRRYSDWQLICDFLQIKSVAEAWNSFKCRRNLNALREVYVEIIEILFDEGEFGINVDDELVERIASIMDRINGGHEDGDDRHKYARSLIIEITRKIELKTVKAIINKKSTYEQF